MTTPAPSSGVPDDAVELDARAGIDTARRLVGEEHRRLLRASERANSTFCWLPPESVAILASARAP